MDLPCLEKVKDIRIFGQFLFRNIYLSEYNGVPHGTEKIISSFTPEDVPTACRHIWVLDFF